MGASATWFRESKNQPTKFSTVTVPTSIDELTPNQKIALYVAGGIVSYIILTKVILN